MSYFYARCNGSFVEIGANDGITFSQSLYFEESLGWRGVCIEPQPRKFKSLLSNRPLCKNLNVGVSNLFGKSVFLQINGYSDMLSSFEEYITPERWDRINRETASHPGQTMERIPVTFAPLSLLLPYLDLTRIDYMSIDTEGNEYEVLLSIDWKSTSIYLLFIESGPDSKDQRIRKMLSTLRYEEKDQIGNNLVFVDTSSPWSHPQNAPHPQR